MSAPLLSILYTRAEQLVKGRWYELGEPLVSTFAREIVDVNNKTVLTAAQCASLGYSPYIRETANFQAVVGGIYGMDTTAGSITATPPVSPGDGDWFIVFDVAKKWATHAAVVGSSSNNFIDTVDTSTTAGPYSMGVIPFVGQGMIRFVWVEGTSTWSVN